MIGVAVYPRCHYGAAILAMNTCRFNMDVYQGTETIRADSAGTSCCSIAARNTGCTYLTWRPCRPCISCIAVGAVADVVGRCHFITVELSVVIQVQPDAQHIATCWTM